MRIPDKPAVNFSICLALKQKGFISIEPTRHI